LFEKKEDEFNMKKNIASQLGFWASVLGVIIGGIYFLVLIYSLSTEGAASLNSPHPFVQLVGGIVTILTVPMLVILFTAIREVNEGDKKVLGSLGVNFIILFAATVSINRFVQLTVIQQSLPNVPADLIRFLPYGSGSVMFALEVLGWGFFSSLAAGFVAPLFSTSRLNKAIRSLFILYAVFSFSSAISFATNVFIPTGPIAWGPILLLITILLSVYFRNLDKQFA
jgi:Na+/melibiose symporter-like transporter